MIRDAADLLSGTVPCALVEIVDARGSVPREVGAWMLVTAEAFAGTIGGGQLEYIALDNARRLLRAGAAAETLDVPLGPEIGQCCGGRARLRIARVGAAARAALAAKLAERRASRPQVLVFGAGHVGRALIAALDLLPVRAILMDGRASELAFAPGTAETRLVALPEAEVAAAPPGSAFVVLTHDHALDFLIADAALARGDAAYVGLIGSKTKRARFAAWRAETGTPRAAALSGLTCPIGGPSGDKRPQVIAAMTVAEIMRRLAATPGTGTAAFPRSKVACND